MKVSKATSGHALLSDASYVRCCTRRLATTAVSSSVALLLAAPIQAQEQPAQPQAEIIEEIQVTGSRIERTGFTTPVPVTSLTMDELLAYEPRGGLAEQLNNLPQFQGNANANNAAVLFGNAGQSNVNMRGMGAQRTLVLLDGSRIVPADRDSNVNPDYLPSALIRRVEAVTGGASAAYGADALAGVTNFIIDREFTGFEARLGAGINQWGDGQNWRASVAGGMPVTDRLHIIGSLETRETNQWARGRADNPDEVRWAQGMGYVINPEWAAWRAENPNADRSEAPVAQRLEALHVHSSRYTTAGLIHGNPGFRYNEWTFTEDGDHVRPFEYGDYTSHLGPGSFGNTSGGPEWYNARRGFANGPGQNAVAQRSGFLGFDYDLSDQTTIWGHGLAGRIQSYQANTGNPENQGIWHIRYSPDNPFLPDLVRDAMIEDERDFIEVHMNGFMSDKYGGGEENYNAHKIWSATVGLNHQLANGWLVRGSYQYGESGSRTEGRGWERMDRVYMGLDTVWADPATGEVLAPGTEGGVAMCRVKAAQRQMNLQGRDFEAELHQWAQENTSENRHDAGKHPDGDAIPLDFPFAVDSVDDSIRNCVPFNLLGHDQSSDAAIDYVRGSDKGGLSGVYQHFAEAMVTGTVHQGWAGPIDMALGATYREEAVWRRVRDQDLGVDALGPPKNVTLPVDPNDPEGEHFTVLQGLPGGYEGGSPNLHNFSTFPTYSGGFDVWEVFTETIVPMYVAPGGDRRVELQLAARMAEYSRAGTTWTYKGGVDFQITNDLRFRATYSSDFREATFSEMFDQQGGGGNVSDPAFDGQTFSITTISGGNPDLEPEKALTTVAGFVYRPSFVPGLSFSADWFNVDQRQRIGSLGTTFIVEECFYEGVFCDRVIRDQDGVIQRVLNVNVNVDFASLEGIDMELGYRMQPNLFSGLSESFSVRLLGNRLLHFSTYQEGQVRSEQNQAGSGGRPHWQTTASLSYNVGNFGMRWNQNWSSGVKRNRNWVSGDHVPRNRWPSQHSESVGFSYNFETDAGSWRTGLNINNPFNRDPLHVPGFGQRSGPGSSSRGDSIGRRFSLNMSYSY